MAQSGSETQQSNPQSEVQNPQLDKASFVQKTAKLHMPFIANNGQMDGQVIFYAKTFGGTVFVTKEGEIVYALPANNYDMGNTRYEVGSKRYKNLKSEFQNPKSISSDPKNLKSSNPRSAIQDDAFCHPECNEGSLVLKRDSSPSAQNDSENLPINNSHSDISVVALKEAIGAVSPLKRGDKGVCNKTPNPNDSNETPPPAPLVRGE